VSTANIPGAVGGGGAGGGGGGGIESPGPSPDKPKKSRGKHNQMTEGDWRLNPMESRDGKTDLLLDDPRLVAVRVSSVFGLVSNH
jgi:hypothetical protein